MKVLESCFPETCTSSKSAYSFKKIEVITSNLVINRLIETILKETTSNNRYKPLKNGCLLEQFTYIKHHYTSN